MIVTKSLNGTFVWESVRKIQLKMNLNEHSTCLESNNSVKPRRLKKMSELQSDRDQQPLVEDCNPKNSCQKNTSRKVQKRSK